LTIFSRQYIAEMSIALLEVKICTWTHLAESLSALSSDLITMNTRQDNFPRASETQLDENSDFCSSIHPEMCNTLGVIYQWAIHNVSITSIIKFYMIFTCDIRYRAENSFIKRISLTANTNFILLNEKDIKEVKKYEK